MTLKQSLAALNVVMLTFAGIASSTPTNSLNMVPLITDQWISPASCAAVTETADGIKVNGAGYRTYGMMYTKDTYNLIGSTTYFKWRASGGGTYSTPGVGFWGVSNAADGSTNHSYAGSIYLDENVWYYTRAKINNDKSFESVTATGNYDDQGGTVYSTSLQDRYIPEIIANEAWRFVSNAGFSGMQGDNYGGTNAFTEIGEIKTTASKNAMTQISLMDFDNNLIPATLQITNAVAENGTLTLKPGAQLSVSDIDKISFMVNSLPGGSIDFAIDGIDVWYPIGCASREFVLSLPDTGSHVITFKFLNGAEKISIDDLRMFKITTTGVGGLVTKTGLRNVICKNVTTGQSLTITKLKGAASWDCSAAGLQIKTGDVIKETLTGSAQ